jgi:hypothetical protein
VTYERKGRALNSILQNIFSGITGTTPDQVTAQLQSAEQQLTLAIQVQLALSAGILLVGIVGVMYLAKLSK